jgi:hypothetical protein
MPIRPRPLAPPQVVVVQLFGRRLLEGGDLDRLGIHAAHHVLDRAVLARRVDALQHQQDAVRVLGGEPVLVVGEQLRPVREQGRGLVLGHLAGVAGIVVPAQLDGAARRHGERCYEVGHEAQAVVHPLTMPAGAAV